MNKKTKHKSCKRCGRHELWNTYCWGCIREIEAILDKEIDIFLQLKNIYLVKPIVHLFHNKAKCEKSECEKPKNIDELYEADDEFREHIKIIIKQILIKKLLDKTPKK